MAPRQIPGQPSLFAAAATDPRPADLAGLLAGPGRLRRLGGTVQVSVWVDAAWRVHALVAEFTRRGLPAGWEAAPASGYTVRTAYTTTLLPLAAAWSGEKLAKRPPAGLHLDGQALRLWVAAAGQATEEAYALRLDPADEAHWPAVGAALAAAGLAAEVRPVPGPGSGPAPAYWITGRRRLARLAELVGDPPATAPADQWPVAPAAIR